MKLNNESNVIARSVAIALPVIARLTKSAEAISMTGSQQAAQSKSRLLWARRALAMTLF